MRRRPSKRAVAGLRIVGPGGKVDRRLEVFCREEGRSVRLEQCRRCAQFLKLAVTAGGRITAIECAGGAAEAPPPPDPPIGAPTVTALTPISRIMSRDVVCVRADVDAEQLEMLLLDGGIHGAPVVDAKGRPLGMISRSDLLRHRHDTDSTGGDGGRTSGGSEGLRWERFDHALASELMTPVVFALPETAPVSRAASFMAAEGVHRIAVLSPDGVLVGLLSAIDVMRWIGEQDGYLTAREA